MSDSSQLPDQLLDYRRNVQETTEGTWQGGGSGGISRGDAHHQQQQNMERYHDSVNSEGHGTWGNLDHLYGKRGSSSASEGSGVQHQGQQQQYSNDDDDYDDEYSHAFSQASSHDGGGQQQGNNRAYSYSDDFGSPDKREGEEGGEEGEQSLNGGAKHHRYYDDEEYSDYVPSDEDTEVRGNLMTDSETGNRNNNTKQHRTDENRYREQHPQSQSRDAKDDKEGPSNPEKQSSLGSLSSAASAMSGRKRHRPDGMGQVHDDDEDDEFVYYEGAHSRNRRGLRGMTFAKARPTIRAILMTVALMLSTYVVLGCTFITIDVGFVPENVRVQSSKFDLGAWSYPPSATGEGGGKCIKYPADFIEEYIDTDSLWRLARGVGIAVVIVGWACLIISWLLAIKAIKNNTLPYKVALAFMSGFMLLFECITFVFLNISLCTKEVWERTSETGATLFERADSCSISRDGKMSICAVVLYLVLVIALCRSRMREDMEHRVKAAGRRAAQLHYHRRGSNDYRGSYNRPSDNYDDDDDDDDLESLGFGEEEKQVDKALDEALSMLESRRFDYNPSDSGDEDSWDNSAGMGTQSGYQGRLGGGNSFGGLKNIDEGESKSESEGSSEMDEIPIHQDHDDRMRGGGGQDRGFTRSISNQSGFSAMSGY